ncbi:MAG: glycoside hydrolase family 32 protein [Bacilli bacterium]|nr:glycoside hydrolase family 32 protein [Bacilli bacterium]
MSSVKKFLPHFHLYPHSGRLNDPNGLCYFNHRFHIFYQSNPFSTLRKKTYWGHYSTKDFVNYQFHGLAISPNTKYDRDGAYSGSAIVNKNKLYLFYTGNVKHKGNYDYVLTGRESNTMRVESTDGIHFTNKKVIFTNKDYPSNLSLHVRDPYVFKMNKNFYMVLGARTKDNHGAYLLYKSKDLTHFKLIKNYKSKDLGYMFECPSVFTLAHKKIFSFSPQGLKAEKNRFKNIYSSGYIVNRINKNNYHEWDLGYDFYAPQIFIDHKGRRILIGWAGLEGYSYSYLEEKEGWKHCLTLPRELTFKNNKIYQQPIKEITNLYQKFKKVKAYIGTNFIANFKVKKDTEVTISNSLIIKFNTNKMSTHFKCNGANRVNREYKINIHEVSIILDNSICEIYLNKGEYVFTSRIYAPHSGIKIKGSNATIGAIKSASYK